MSRFILNVTSGQLEGLRGLSESTGTPIAHFVRQAIDQFLNSGMHCGVVISGQVASGSVLVMRGGR